MSETVEGMAQLLAKLQQLQADAEYYLIDAAEAAGYVVERAAKKIVPVDTGNLRRSIFTEVAESSPERAVVEVGTDVEYAQEVEEGTSTRAAQPYLRPALDENADKAREVAAKVLAKAIKGALK